MRRLERVLIADDNRVFCAVLDELFRELGAQVVSVTNGRDAYTKLMAEPFDLAVLDILMPQLDGFAVLRRIRRSDRLVVFVTTAVYKGRRWEEEARVAHNAQEFLPKPIDPDTLREKVGKYFQLPDRTVAAPRRAP